MLVNKNNSGRVLIIFLIIAVVLTVSIAGTTIFFFQSEINRRKTVEADLEKSQAIAVAMQTEVSQTKKQITLLEEKNKEADERINSLLDELELEEGLKEEMKTELASVKKQLEEAVAAKDKAAKMVDEGSKETKARITELEAKLTKEINQKLALENELKALKQQGPVVMSGGKPLDVQTAQENVAKDLEEVNLEKIVVVPDGIPEGRVLSVDIDTEFVIVNLGEKDGIKQGNLLSVYRGKEYLGDIRITRVQPEMSAADLVPPFSAQLVRKNDQVVSK